jgi:putative nucleotidyltransferase with HDIG domain
VKPSPSQVARSPSGRSVKEDDDLDAAVWVGAALESALRARAPGVQASTPLMRQLATKVGQELGLDAQSRSLLDLCVRVRDVGMIALPDQVVLATTPLTPEGWELMNRHPVVGAQLLDELFVVASAAEIVRAHHERWDGGGYPDGLSGDSIPRLSRVIATCDAFVAMASDRPYRRGMGPEAALERVCRERGTQFDPRMVDALIAALAGARAQEAAPSGLAGEAVVTPDVPRAQGSADGSADLMSAVKEFDVVPVFEPAYEQILAAVASDTSTGGELVSAIENDTGLTIAILRRAQAVAGRRPIANIPDAVGALTRGDIEQAVSDLPRAAFPWRTSPLEVLLARSRVHAQAVARAATRIAVELAPPKRDDVLVAALLHDIGKLVLGRVSPEYDDASESTTTPEKRLREEQRVWGVDHASLGSVLLRRWNLPKELARTVAEHHTSEADGEVATYVRLADMVVHHAQGDTVDRGKMLQLAQSSGLSPGALRELLFNLPHTGGSQRRRAEPSPLSSRQTLILRLLAEGKLYKVIALQLGVSQSTVRTHLHNIYEKLAVRDRAQAVLRATEMGWI